MWRDQTKLKQKFFANSPEAREFYIFVRHLKMSPKDYYDLSYLQRQIILYHWNKEMQEREDERKRYEAEIQKGKRRT